MGSSAGPSAVLLLAALAFAFVVGANDGAAILGANLAGKAVRPLPGLVILLLALVVVPVAVGTAVAATLAGGLVAFGDEGGQRALLVAVAVTIVLVWGSTQLGLPTSVTQALAGAMVGAGLGSGLPVDLGVLLRVVLALALVPLLAGAAAAGAGILLLRLRVRGALPDHLRRLHALAFALVAVAYGANDGQKLLAVLAVAAGEGPDRVAVNLPLVLGAAILFGLGTAVGVRRLAARLGRKLFLVRPLNIVVAGYAAGLAVLASAAAGAPVSMSHTTTAGLVGSEVVLETYRRVRWEQVIRVGATWVTTVPGAVILAAVVAGVVR